MFEFLFVKDVLSANLLRVSLVYGARNRYDVFVVITDRLQYGVHVTRLKWEE